jgi:hypothetical protein
VVHCKPDGWLLYVRMAGDSQCTSHAAHMRCVLPSGVLSACRVRGLGPACSSTGHSQVSAGYLGTAGYSAALATWLEAWVGGPRALGVCICPL